MSALKMRETEVGKEKWNAANWLVMPSPVLVYFWFLCLIGCKRTDINVIKLSYKKINWLPVNGVFWVISLGSKITFSEYTSLVAKPLLFLGTPASHVFRKFPQIMQFWKYGLGCIVWVRSRVMSRLPSGVHGAAFGILAF